MNDRDTRARTLARIAREVDDERVLAALASVPREAFVPPRHRARAWENEPLPIGEGQTISQPLVVARMLALLEVRPGDRALDVGTGSGWHAALLAALGARVWSIERHPALAAGARAALAEAGIEGVTVLEGDGSRGWPDAAPYDAVNVAAAAATGVPAALREQLAPGGRLIAPVGAGDDQHLVLVRGGREHVAEPVRFVPLVEDG